MKALHRTNSIPPFRDPDHHSSALRARTNPSSTPFNLGHCQNLSGSPYEDSGNPAAPIIVVLGGISADRHVYAHSEDCRPGWWEDLVGPGRAVDSNRYRILGLDYLGDTRASTASAGMSTKGHAKALAAILDHLNAPRVHALIGASYGGMVGLAFAAMFPERLLRLVVISAAHQAHPMATAWRSLQRRLVRWGLTNGEPKKAMCLARMLAMTSYRSHREFAERFTGPPQATESGFRFPVEDYLESRGKAFANCFDPGAFLCLSEALDLHRVGPEEIGTPTTLVTVSSDALVPPEQMRELAGQLGGSVDLLEIDSLYGHDAFLKEPHQLGPILATALHAKEVCS